MLLKIEEASKLLGVQSDTLRKRLARGSMEGLKTYKVCGKWCIDEESLMSYLASVQVPQTGSRSVEI